MGVKNLSAIEKRDKSIPLIIYVNHSSWWDGLILFEILRRGDFDSFVLMEERQLKNLQFFRRLGAFSVVREDPKEILKSLRYIVKNLETGISKTLVIFPQGEILPNDIRPIKFYGGLTFLTKKLQKCNSIPCSIRIEFLNNFKPEIFAAFGNLEYIEKKSEISKKNFTAHLENKLTENLDRLKFDIINKNSTDFKKIF